MEDFNGLEPRLQALEALAEQIQADKAQATQEKNLQSILDQYGLQFNGRRDVGMEILNQLNRQGVDVSAASSNAIQDIITDMQSQISQLYNDFNQKRQEMDQVQQEAAQLADQINKIDETVANATGSENQPNANIEPPAPEMQLAEPVATDMMPPASEEQVMPPEAPAPEMSPAEPAPVAEPISSAPDPNAVVSDVRVKNVETPNPMGNQQGFFIKKTDKVNVAPGPDILSDQQVKEIHTPTPTFGRHLISVASRGF